MIIVFFHQNNHHHFPLGNKILNHHFILNFETKNHLHLLQKLFPPKYFYFFYGFIGKDQIHHLSLFPFIVKKNLFLL